METTELLFKDTMSREQMIKVVSKAAQSPRGAHCFSRRRTDNSDDTTYQAVGFTHGNLSRNRAPWSLTFDYWSINETNVDLSVLEI